MAFERFPYSNFHDLNLDWIIEQVKQWSIEWSEVKRAYDEFEGDLSEIFDKLEQLTNKDLELETKISGLSSRIDTMDATLEQLQTALQVYQTLNDTRVSNIDTRVAVLEDTANWYMYSPFTGEYVPLADVITTLAGFHMQDALTAEEYDTLALDASVYDGKELTAIDYDARGKILLP